MSGTGGTVYDPQPPRSDCDRLTFRTILNSPVPDVVATINNEDHLDIVAESRLGGLQVAVALHNGRRAGAITADALVRLLECIAQGNEYIAEVISRSGARVEIQVRRK